jgi:hypothetical protein
VATQLADHLQAHTSTDEPRWTVFDRNLVERVLQDHNLPQRLAKFMPENWTSEIQDTMDELFGLHPPSWLLVRETAQTILRLVKIGNVIIIGRAGNVVTSKLDSVLHIRLVAPVEERVKHIQEMDHLDYKQAMEFVQREDRGRRRYLKRFFRQDIEDPLMYHLTINTELIGYERATLLIGGLVRAGRAQTRDSRSNLPVTNQTQIFN